MRLPTTVILAAGLALTGAAGFLASTALSVGAQGETRTVTVDVGGPTGPTGPQGASRVLPARQARRRCGSQRRARAPGPTGAAGPAGATGADRATRIGRWSGGPCQGAPAGWEAGVLVLNAPGGQVSLWTCLAP